MICYGCKQQKQHLRGAIIDGKYNQYCSACFQATTRPPNAGSAQYSRDRDRDSNEASLIQPWTAKGKPNKEFIRLYKDEAHEMFSQEELEAYG